MDLPGLYELAKQEKIPIYRYPMAGCESMSIETETGSVVGMDPSVCDNGARELTHLSHELGHCVTGSFYNVWSGHDLRRRHEDRANKWAIRTVIPAPALDEAVATGCTTLWELAEHFGVTEDMVRKAVCLHVHGNLATDLYF